MPFYQGLKYDRGLYREGDQAFIATRLLDLRASLAKRIPERDLHGSLLLGTWNIRDFDGNKFKQGPRRQESLHYLAEVLARFDICAVQEVNEDLRPLEKVLRLMGPSYDFMATDVTLGDSGNRERLAFVYDTRKVRFRSVVGELVVPDPRGGSARQIARTPMIAEFQAGWFKFTICTAHIYFGDNSPSSEGYKRRVAEISTIAKILARRAEAEDTNYIFLGDFNVIKREDATFKALEAEGFVVPPELHRSNMGGDKDYDQIAFRSKEFQKIKAGVFDWREAVFRDADFDYYKTRMTTQDERGRPVPADKLEDHYHDWRTWQMSDHLPLWVQFAIDFSDDYLRSIVTP